MNGGETCVAIAEDVAVTERKMVCRDGSEDTEHGINPLL
jgi:hypothetical protein